ncbi:MAG: vitamin B12 dependent-methionine synthase activation domain-containing protein [Desulfobacterales bacterium]
MNSAIKLSFKDLEVTPEDVSRYAGGSNYKPDAKRKRLAADILERASTLVNPAFVYTIRPLYTADPVFSFLPYENNGADKPFLASIICTIGSELESETSKLMTQGKALDALFLDAVGVALLEALSDEVHSYLKNEAAKNRLFAGCRFGPGYGNIPVDAQKILFESVNAYAIGVKLKESGIIFPLKSLSFWIMLTTKPPEASIYKCQECTLKNCAYRIAR